MSEFNFEAESIVEEDIVSLGKSIALDVSGNDVKEKRKHKFKMTTLSSG